MQKIRYEQIRPKGLRQDLRNKILETLYRSKKLIERCTEEEIPRVQFVYFHHVFGDEIRGFKRILEYLKSKFEVVSYTEAVNKIVEGKINNPTACVSFDDGLKNCLVAGRIMESYDISACFFVCPSVVDVEDIEVLEKYAKRLSLPICEVLSWRDIHKIKKMGHEVGGHTLTHPRLSKVSENRIEEEVGKTYKIIRERTGDPVHFAWPYGRFEDFSEEAARIVFGSGFLSCASAVRGCHVQGLEGPYSSLCIRRDRAAAGEPTRNVKVFLEMNKYLPWRQENEWPKEWNI